MKRLVLVSVILTALVACFPLPAQAVKSLVRLEHLSPAALRVITHRDYDIAKVGKDYVELVADGAQIKRFQKSAFAIATLIPDLDAYVAGILKKQTREAKYFTYQTMTEALKAWAQKYPKICRLESIGKSWEGRDIWAFKVSDNVGTDEKEPAALIMGAHHSREWCSFEIPLEAIKRLVEGYGTHDGLTRLVDSREIWFVPMVNPDGVNFSQTSSRYWRKNRRKNSNNSFGVDPNRNYGYQWGVSGASTYEGSDTYMGPKAFSEPETCAIRDFAKREKIAGSISIHSYAEEILYPWSYAEGVTNPDHDIFAKLGAEMGAINHYTPIISAEMYPSAGDTDDFLYSELKSLSFTFEVGTTFIPEPNQIAGINDLNVPAVFHLIDKAGTYGLVTPAGQEILPEIDTPSAVNALHDLEPLARHDVAARQVERLQTLLAQRVVRESQAGESTALQLLQQGATRSRTGAAALEKARAALWFEALHAAR